MEHNPQTVLAIGEIALFLIGVILSIILLAILLLPSLLKFTIPHWVQVQRPKHIKEEEESAEIPSLFDIVLPKLFKHGYQIITKEEDFLSITKDGATRYHLYLDMKNDRLSMFRQGDETESSESASILSGAGIAWVSILCDEALQAAGYKVTWAWDQGFHKTNTKPFGALMYQLILLNPWR